MPSASLLFLADTHLGLDLPQKPRVDRRRRGDDFFRNLSLALEPALRGEVAAVVHGGDLLYRSKVPGSLVQQALAPLKQVADAGVPVILVPGNHERSQIPYRIYAAHRRIHIFDGPSTYTLNLGGLQVAFGGFPYCREGVRRNFPALLEQTGLLNTPADVHVLCIHHCFEGATVGPSGYTFRSAEDVIRAADLPTGLAAVLSGHIHRHQVLTADLAGRPLRAPVLYPGSIERTSTAEIDEEKGYLRLEVEGGAGQPGRLKAWSFVPLPARPMRVVELTAGESGERSLETQLRAALAETPEDGVLSIRVQGRLSPAELAMVSAARIRALAPPSMNVSLSLSAYREKAMQDEELAGAWDAGDQAWRHA